MIPARARRAPVVLSLLCLVLLTGCTRAVAGSGDAAPASAGAPPGLERYYTQTLAWGTCLPFAIDRYDESTYTDPQYECAGLSVPLDYAEPDGETATIAVLRRPAPGGDPVASLVVNPGGPGAQGTAAVVYDPYLTDALGDTFDLVGFDPRGIAASTPAIDCLDDAEWDAERLDDDDDTSPAGIAGTEDENRRFAQLCTERSGGADVLANVGTRDVARDMDVLRAALGERTLTYLGYSYGTLLGTLYAEMFPHNVRALVLDGAVDPSLTTVVSGQSQQDSFVGAFEAYATDCATDPSCPVGTDPAAAQARLDALVDPLAATPAPAQDGFRQLSADDARIGIDAALYSDALWPDLSAALTDLAAGDGTALLEIADGYWGRDPDGRYDNSTEAFIAVRCADDERVTDRTDLAPEDALDVCAFWPSPPTNSPHVPIVPGLPRTLVISTTGDPATPYEEGVSLAGYLDAALLTVNAEQHTASYQGIPCVDDVVTAYLTELVLPETDPDCSA